MVISDLENFKGTVDSHLTQVVPENRGNLRAAQMILGGIILISKTDNNKEQKNNRLYFLCMYVLEFQIKFVDNKT